MTPLTLLLLINAKCNMIHPDLWEVQLLLHPNIEDNDNLIEDPVTLLLAHMCMMLSGVNTVGIVLLLSTEKKAEKLLLDILFVVSNLEIITMASIHPYHTPDNSLLRNKRGALLKRCNILSNLWRRCCCCQGLPVCASMESISWVAATVV